MSFESALTSHMFPSQDVRMMNIWMDNETNKSFNATSEALENSDFATRCIVYIDKNGRRAYRTPDEARAHADLLKELEASQRQAPTQPAPSPSITIDYDKLADIIIARGKHKKTK